MVGARFARVKVPPLLTRFMEAGEPSTFVPLEDVIAANLGLLFPGMEILAHYPFRVTRASDLELDDDAAEDLLRALEAELRRRRFTPAVRLEVDRRMPAHLVDLLSRELLLDEQYVHRLGGPLGLADLWSLVSVDRPDLKYPPFHPSPPQGVVRDADGDADIFATLDQRDLLVHHPYDSFALTVQAFIEQAASDPSVLAIKQTLYRTSGESPIVDALIAAAEAGKQVVVLVEIKARFDEQANIAWARMLERAGCHVVYGLVGLKTHCKLLLVVRNEPDGIRRYVHIGTGNYHPTTATPVRGHRSADHRSGACRGREPPVQPADRLLAPHRLRLVARCAARPAPTNREHDRGPGRTRGRRPTGADRHEAEQPRRRGRHRRSVRRVERRRQDRSGHRAASARCGRASRA